MKLNRYDIGGEIISIITKGMYPDPRDALREYIQNGVDASAQKMSVKIRQNSIVIEDDGIGMNHIELRESVRVGVSEKNPKNNVGFMGIGIYSSFHLCDKMTIYSRGSENISNKLEMNFGDMRALLEDQKEKRLKNKITQEELIDLQTLLENYITLSKNESVNDAEFPIQGTRVELTGLETEFYSALSEFDEVAEYLRNVIPLHFDEVNFSYAKKIENKIKEICDEHKHRFELIDLSLQINERTEDLYRPYKDKEFYNKNDVKPQQPKFFVIKGIEFFGVAWGCLNSVRKKIENQSLRGFILKKQGFSIGKRELMVKFFPRRNTFFDRYSGEIIIVNPKLMPNASRTELEYSPWRTLFYEALIKIGEKYDGIGHEYQEYSKADDELIKLSARIKSELGSFNEFEGDPSVLVDKIIVIKEIISDLNGRIKRGGFSVDSIENAKSLLVQAKELLEVFQERLNNLTKDKQKKIQIKKKSALQIAKKLSQIKIKQISERINYESLYELLSDLEFTINDELREVILLIDEKFIQNEAASREEYYKILNELKNEIINL